MDNIYNLLQKLAKAESQLEDTKFVAPCVQGGKVRTRVAGMIYTFMPQPRNFQGWGVFQPANAKVANLQEEADLEQISTSGSGGLLDCILVHF